MRDPIFSRHHREPGAWDIPRTPTNEERLREFRKAAPVVVANGKTWKWHRRCAN